MYMLKAVHLIVSKLVLNNSGNAFYDECIFRGMCFALTGNSGIGS